LSDPPELQLLVRKRKFGLDFRDLEFLGLVHVGSFDGFLRRFGEV